MIYCMNALNSAPDIIALQEIWQFSPDASFPLPGYQPLFYKQRRNNVQGGWVGIYIKSCFTCNLLPDCTVFHDRIIESITVEILLKNNSKVYVSSLYRPGTHHTDFTPIDQFNQFSDLFSSLCNKLLSFNSNFYILGDTNLDVLKYGKCDFVTEFIDKLFSFGLLQIITKPTRCTPHSASIIDHIITNSNANEFSTTILISNCLITSLFCIV